MFEQTDRWLDGLPSSDFPSPELLGAEIVGLQQLATRCEAAAARRLAAFERSGGWTESATSLASWLQAQLTCYRGQARRLIGIARFLDLVPHLAACYDGGEVSSAHMSAVVDVLSGLPAATITDVDDWLVEAALNADPYRLRTELAELRSRLDPPKEGKADEKRHEQRRLSSSLGFNSMTTLWGRLTPEVAEKHAAAISAASRPDVDGENRTPAQRRADAYEHLLDLVLGTKVLPVDGGERPHLNLHVDLDALTGPEDGDCSTEPQNAAAVAATVDGGPGVPRFDWTGPTSRHTARRIACDAIVTRFSSSNGEILDVGRATRVVPTGLRKLIRARDNGCRWPGCSLQHRWTEIHHVQPWAEGGPTDRDHCLLLCQAHHRSAHNGLWTVTLLGPGRIAVRPRTPAGPYWEIRLQPPLNEPDPPGGGLPEGGAARPSTRSRSSRC